MTVWTEMDAVHRYMVVPRGPLTWEVVGGRTFAPLVCYSRERAELLASRLRQAFEDGIEAERNPPGENSFAEAFFGGS